MFEENSKYKKINKRLYHDFTGEGRPLNWIKRPETLYLKLFEVQPVSVTSLEGDGELISDDLNYSNYNTDKENDLEKIEELNQIAAKTASTRGKIVKSSNGIRATAILENRRINFLENGEIKFLKYKTIEFHCREGDGVGMLGHNAGSILEYDCNHDEPYISIETYLPSTTLNGLIRDINQGKIKEILVCLKCDVFQSEMERSLAEPWMSQDYTIESESSNFCGIVWLSANGKKYIPIPKNDEFVSLVDDQHPVHIDPSVELLREPILNNYLLAELQRTNKMLKAIAIILGIFCFIFLLISS